MGWAFWGRCLSDGGIAFLSIFSCHRAEQERLFFANPLVFSITSMNFKVLGSQCPTPFIDLVQRGAKPVKQKLYCGREETLQIVQKRRGRERLFCPFHAPSHCACIISCWRVTRFEESCCPCSKICKEHVWSMKSHVIAWAWWEL